MVLRGTTSQKVSQSGIIIWILFLPAILGFYALTNTSEGDIGVLNTFFILYVASGFGLLFAQTQKGSEGLVEFWTLDIDKQALKWIGIGIGLVFLVIYLVLGIADNLDPDGIRNAQLVGISLAGFIMTFALLRTKSIFVPISIHGVYNGFVTYVHKTPLSVTGFSQKQLDVLPQLSEIGIDLGIGKVLNITDLANEILWQITVVATSEEFLRLAMLVGVVWIIHRRWNNEPLAIIVGVFVSVVFWAYLHTANAI